MDTFYQEDLREKNVFAVWAGDIANEGELAGYLETPFERDFGFLLDQEEPPHFTRVFTEPRFHAHYNRPFVKVEVQQLVDQFELSDDVRRQLVKACREKGLLEAKTVVVFPHLRYREHLLKAAELPLMFVGNFNWPEGTESWNESESKRLLMPPLPRLKKRVWGDSGRFTWEGIIRLEGWKGFAPYKELRDGWEPTRGCRPDGDFNFSVEPGDQRSTPTPAQVRAFEHLLLEQHAVLERVLDAIAREYAIWREISLNDSVSRDGGKTWVNEPPFPPDWMPPLTNPHDLKRLIRPGDISIENTEEAGIAMIEIGFACKWDEEHGMGVQYLNGKVTKVGDIW